MSWLYYSEPEREYEGDVVTPWREDDHAAEETLPKRRAWTEREGRNQLVLPGFAHLVKDAHQTPRQPKQD